MMTVTIDSESTNTKGTSDMTTTWITADKPVKAPAPAWRKGARALAKRFGTCDIMAAEDPNMPGRWAITQSYALRFFDADTIEAQALSLWRDSDPTSGVCDGGARVAVKVHKGGKNDMTNPEMRFQAPTWDSMNSLIPEVSWRHVAATSLVPVGGLSGEVDAVNDDGEMLTRFATTILQGVLDSGETLMVNPDAPLKPAVVVCKDGTGLVVVGLAMPVRVP